MMKQELIQQLIFLARILLAVGCGAIIGYERESRFKTAGIRTHVIVSLAAALMMVVSKYGFFDVIALDSVNLDPSRIAAGIVTAIGFLGAGVIFVRNQTVSGLTTAAGIWATVGVGMAIGAGMYLLGIAATLLMLVIQFLLHKKFRFIKSPVVEQVTVRLTGGESAFAVLSGRFRENGIEIISAKIKRSEAQEGLVVKLYVKFPQSYQLADIIRLVQSVPEIQSADF